MIIKIEMEECAFGEIYGGGRAESQENVVVPDAKKRKKRKEREIHKKENINNSRPISILLRGRAGVSKQPVEIDR